MYASLQYYKVNAVGIPQLAANGSTANDRFEVFVNEKLKKALTRVETFYKQRFQALNGAFDDNQSVGSSHFQGLGLSQNPRPGR